MGTMCAILADKIYRALKMEDQLGIDKNCPNLKIR